MDIVAHGILEVTFFGVRAGRDGGVQGGWGRYFLLCERFSITRTSHRGVVIL